MFILPIFKQLQNITTDFWQPFKCKLFFPKMTQKIAMKETVD